MRCARPAERDENVSMSAVIGSSEAPASERAVAQVLLEVHDEQERRRAHGRVHEEGDEVGARELAAGEDGQRHHRLRAPPLGDEEGDAGDDGQHGGQRGQAGEPRGGRLDQGVDRAGQGERQADGAGHVDAAGRALVAGLGHVAQRDGDARGREREVDDEDQAPRHGVDQPAADERTERGDDRAQARPRPDGSGPVAGPERGRDHGQAPRHQQGRRRALQQAGDDEEVGRRRRRAQRRRHGEPREADDEHPPAAVEVAEGTAEDEQGAEGQQVGRQDPLELREAGAEVGRDRGQGRVDDRRVEEGHAGAEDGGGEDPAALGRPQSDGGADDRQGRGGDDALDGTARQPARTGRPGQALSC